MSDGEKVQAHSEAPQNRRPSSSKQPFNTYVVRARELLDRHGLTVPDKTTEMIARTIAKPYKLESKQKKGLSPRERIKKALVHAAKLLEYTERVTTGNQRLRASISRRAVALSKALNDFGVVVWLATATPSIDVVDVLERLKSGWPSKHELMRLILALKSALPANGKPGRPREDTTHVLRGACIAWLRAGRPEKCTWDPTSGDPGTVKGPLAVFARDLLSCCQLAAPSDNALYCALRFALHDH
jgi:hypothetical protein